MRRSLREAADDRITTSAASLAFHWFFAIFPGIIAVVALMARVGLSPKQLQTVIHDMSVLLPRQMSAVLIETLRNRSDAATGLALVAGTLVAVWSSLEAMAALQVSLDVAFEVRKDRGFLGRRLVGVPLLVVTLAVGGAATGLLVLGDPIRSLLPASAARPAFDAVFLVIRWGGALALTFLLLSVYYVFGPNRSRRRWQWSSPGSALAAGGWLAASGLFSLYLSDFGHESRTYGAVAGVAVLLLWLYLTATVVLLGAELDCELARPPKPHAIPAGPTAAASGP